MADFLFQLLCMSILGTLLAGMLAVFRMVFKNWVSQSVFYYLWILVLLCLCVPMRAAFFIPDAVKTVVSRMSDKDSTFDAGSVSGLIEKNEVEDLQDQTARSDGTQLEQEKQQDGFSAGQKETARQKKPAAIKALNAAVYKIISLADKYHGFIWWTVLWGIGAAVSIFGHIAGYIRFSYRVRQHSREAGKEVKVYQEAQCILRELDSKGRVQLVVCSLIDTPMLMGVWHPVIVLPADIREQRYLKDIVAHELTHARRHDLIYKWSAVMITSLYWFNPLMVFIRREINRLCELSCDEAVMRGMDKERRRHYGETLLAMAAVPSGKQSMMTTTFSREKNLLKERLWFIVKYRKKGMAAALLSVMLVLTAGGCSVAFGVDGMSYSSGGEEKRMAQRSDLGQKNLIDVSGENPKSASDITADVQFGDAADSGSKNASGSNQENVLDLYQAVLQGEAQFLYAESADGEYENSRKPVNIADVPAIFSPFSSYASTDRFTVIDLDGDGEQEVVLKIIDVAGDMGGYMILHHSDGQVYGYTSHYKTFEFLKADGTYGCSSLAAGTDTGAEEGICKIVEFTETGFDTDWVICCVMDKYMNPDSYIVNHESADEGEYNAAMKRQKEKQDAVWYGFMDRDIQEAFRKERSNEQINEASGQTERSRDGAEYAQNEVGNLENKNMYSFSVRVSDNKELTIVLDTAQPEKYYFAVDRVLVYDKETLIQTIDAASLPPAEEYTENGLSVDIWDGLDMYAWDGLFVNQDSVIGEPYVRDLNFDGAEDFGLLAVGTYSKNIPYSYFLWNKEEQCFDYGFTLFGTLKTDPEKRQLIESSYDVYGEEKRVYYYDSEGKLRMKK